MTDETNETFEEHLHRLMGETLGEQEPFEVVSAHPIFKPMVELSKRVYEWGRSDEAAYREQGEV